MLNLCYHSLMPDNEPNRCVSTLPNYYDLPKVEKKPEFDLLREQALAQRRSDVQQRLSTNLIPTEEELSAGTYKEAIEPQCREAIFTMRRKGYDTYSSGFGSSNSQVVDGSHFRFDEDTVRLLTYNNYVVYEVASGVPSILFRPENPNLDEIRELWNKLASLLPDLGKSAPSRVKDVRQFRGYFRRINPELFIS